MLINTSRGGLIDTRAVIAGLKSGQIGHLGLDVYEEEGDLFFDDLSDKIIADDVFARLLTFPNVLITGHQAFFTDEAMTAIARTTISNIDAFADGPFTGKSAVDVASKHLKAPAPDLIVLLPSFSLPVHQPAAAAAVNQSGQGIALRIPTP